MDKVYVMDGMEGVDGVYGVDGVDGVDRIGRVDGCNRRRDDAALSVVN